VVAFVINEWLWHDLAGDNGLQAQRETFSVVEKFPASDHRLVWIQGSRFDQKAWNLCKGTQPMIVQRIGRAFVLTVRENADRCLILTSESLIALPDNLASSTNVDDHYLLQAQLTVGGAILVSTDTPLREAAGTAGLHSLSRDEFLKTYF